MKIRLLRNIFICCLFAYPLFPETEKIKESDFTFESAGTEDTRSAPSKIKKPKGAKSAAPYRPQALSRKNKKIMEKIERVRLLDEYRKINPIQHRPFIREAGFAWTNMFSFELYNNIVSYYNVDLPYLSFQFGYHYMFSTTWGVNAGLGFCPNPDKVEFSTRGTLFAPRDELTSTRKMTVKAGVTRAINANAGVYGGIGMATEAPVIIFLGGLVKIKMFGATLTADIPINMNEFKFGLGLLYTLQPFK